MDDRRLFRVGALGAVAAAICCATPLLVVLLAAVGISGAAGWLDYVLLPALAAFAAIMVYASLRRRRRSEADALGSDR